METKPMKKYPSDEARQNRINEIRKQLAEGTYQMDTDKLASALIRTMQGKSVTRKNQEDTGQQQAREEDQAA